MAMFEVSLGMASEKPFETFDPQKSRNWSFFTDGVMGGVSSGKAFFGKSGSDNFVRLEGRVSTANNGGFIQIRHNLERYLDKDIKGISLKVRGNGEKYYVFVRTTSTLLPWQFYNASFKTSKNWRVIKINFDTFQILLNLLKKFRLFLFHFNSSILNTDVTALPDPIKRISSKLLIFFK